MGWVSIGIILSWMRSKKLWGGVDNAYAAIKVMDRTLGVFPVQYQP